MSTRWLPGLVSVTFRSLPAAEIIRLAVENGLQAIEWSEDHHVLPGDGAGARLLGQATEAAGLCVAAYGSYYRLGEYDDPTGRFRESLSSARAMGAPLIRVWAGTWGSAVVGEACRARLALEARLIADMAAQHGIKLALEWHKDTLTDTNDSALRFLAAVQHANLYCLWQPTVALSPAQRVAGIRLLGDRLLNCHVYSWPDGQRGPLNAAEWQLYLQAVSGGGERCALLEFVRDDSPAQLARDAAVLHRLLKDINRPST